MSIGTTPGGTDILNNVDVGNVTEYATATDLPPNTIVYVTITPYFANGTVLSCTEESFTTGTTTVTPECTSLSFPIDGDIDVPVSTDLMWNAIANADGYFLSIGIVPGGTSILNNSDVGLTTTYNHPNDLPEGTVIYITITPYNSAGNAMSCNY